MNRGWLCLAALLACGKARSQPDAGVPVVAVAPSVAPAVAPSTVSADVTVPTEALKTEAPEENPRSEMVKLKLAVWPTIPGFIYWGAKKLGPIEPKPLELLRPRYSGPMDIVVKADGFLNYHARLYTDRDDRLTLRLVRKEDGSKVFGYRATVPAH